MTYRSVVCPTCGNETTARVMKGTQRCKFCRRLFKLVFSSRNHGRNYTAELVEDENQEQYNEQA